MRPATSGELAQFLADNFEAEDIVKLLDLQPVELVYYLGDPIEEKYEDLCEELFDEDKTPES